MNLLAENNGKSYVAIAIDNPDDFSSPFPDVLFPCLIWDQVGHFTDGHRSSVAKALLESGCRYAVCAGENCEAWHHAIDSHLVQQHLDDSDEVREALHVMTTSHEGETPDEVAFFFVLNTNFDYHDFTHYLVLHVGTGPAKEPVDAAIRKYAFNKDEV
jgi:hypothetical protein